MFFKIKIRVEDFFKDLYFFGFFIAITNMLWPYISKSPGWLGGPIMNFKHKKIKNKIKVEFNHIINKNYDIELKVNNSKKIIWFCWLQGFENMPNTVRECYNSIRKNNSNVDLNFIDLNTFHNYINIPNHILNNYEKGLIGHAHFSDIIRTFLLADYGGMWIDSTIYNTEKIPDSFFDMHFYSIKRNKNGYYVSENKWSNFVLASNRVSLLFPIVKQLFIEYTKKYNRFIDYFLMDYFIQVAYEAHQNIKDDIDTLHYNNPHCHDLIRVLNEEFNVKKLDKLKSKTIFFKLNWKESYNEEINQNPTNWARMINPNYYV
jgi:hypothetical protein